MGRTIAMATLIAGTLDILFAVSLSLFFGQGPMNMLRFVASGPFPAATGWGGVGSVLGLVVHFTLMGIMAAFFVILVQQRPAILDNPIRSGIAYGLVTYVVMNWIVVPARFDVKLPPSTTSITTQLFAHIVLVGIPFALIAARGLRAKALA